MGIRMGIDQWEWEGMGILIVFRTSLVRIPLRPTAQCHSVPWRWCHHYLSNKPQRCLQKRKTQFRLYHIKMSEIPDIFRLDLLRKRIC